MKIAMLTNLYPPVASGSSTQCSGLARELARLGHEIVVVTARLAADSPEQETVDGVPVYRIPALHLPKMPISLNFAWLNATYWPANLRRVAAILERHGSEIVHAHNHMFDMALIGARLARGRGLPLVVTLHTIIKHSNPVYDALLARADRWFLKRAVIDPAAAIICPDVNVVAYLDERFARRQDAIIPYGVHLAEPTAADIAALRERFGLDGKQVVLSLGHIHAIRNRVDLIRAFRHVVETLPEARLLVVGQVGDETPVRLARELGLGEAVIFAGAQPARLVPAFFALADLEAHWLNQDTPERTSLGVASMEAMRAGRVVLAAANVDTFGPGVLRSGENVVIVEPGRPEALAATIAELLRDAPRRERIAAAARRTAERHFSWDRVAAAHLELYGETQGQRRREAA